MGISMQSMILFICRLRYFSLSARKITGLYNYIHQFQFFSLPQLICSLFCFYQAIPYTIDRHQNIHADVQVVKILL